MLVQKAIDIVAGWCSQKEYCSQDIQDKLRKWELSETEIAQVMTFLYKHRFIDDARYARAYAEDKFRFNHWGKQKISRMLRQKGIAPEITEAALARLDEKSYYESCRQLLEQKRRSLSEPDPYKLRARLFRFAAGRGFSFELIKRCIDETELPAPEDEEETTRDDNFL